MSWRPHGHARVDPTSPSAFGVCDRCGLLHNLSDLKWQFEWRGNRKTNLKIRVCRSCTDKPQDQYRPVVIPPDPVPVRDPRPEQYASEDQGVSAAESVKPPAFGPLIPE